MTGFLFLKLQAVIVSVALAAGLLARDHGLRANRIVATFFFCNAWWAGCEFFLFQTSDPELAVATLRWMTFGWAPLGVLGLTGSLCLSSMRDHPIGRATPFFAGMVLLVLALTFTTDWIIEDAVSTGDSWRPKFGPAFPLAYGSMMVPMLSVLHCWRRLMTLPGHRGQNVLARIVFIGLSVTLISGTGTAVIAPIYGVAAVGVSTTLLSLVGLGTAWVLDRYGYSLISPEAYSREIFETLDDGVVVIGDAGRIRDVNAAFVRLVGRAETSLLGRPIEGLFPDFANDPMDSDSDRLVELVDANERHVPVVLSAPVAVTAGSRVLARAFVVRDRREVVSLQRQLAVSGRLAAVGDLSKSISESIRQPAAATRAQLEALDRSWRDMMSGLPEGAEREAAAEGTELIEECVGGLDRVDAIVDEVGSFSTDSREGHLECHDLAEIVESGLRIARVQAKPHVTVEFQFDPDVQVLCYRPELERVVTNVLVNAFHALEDSAASEVLAHLSIAVCAQGSRALVHVEDDGCGIAPDMLDRVFDPFFTTKPVGKGTGLGLAISYHILRKHGGEIRLSSIEKSGTSVAIELPRYESD